MNNHITTEEKKRLDDLPWMSLFKVYEFGYILVKSSLVKNDLIAAHGPGGSLLWYHKDMPVIQVSESIYN